MKRTINREVWKYFEDYKESDKLEGFDTASRRYYIEKIRFNDGHSVFAITTQSATPTRVIDTIKVVEYDNVDEARSDWSELMNKSKIIATISYT